MHTYVSRRMVARKLLSMYAFQQTCLAYEKVGDSSYICLAGPCCRGVDEVLDRGSDGVWFLQRLEHSACLTKLDDQDAPAPQLPCSCTENTLCVLTTTEMAT